MPGKIRISNFTNKAKSINISFEILKFALKIV